MDKGGEMMICSLSLVLLILCACPRMSNGFVNLLKKCCEGRICYDLGYPYFPLPPPECAETLDITMTLFNRNNPSNGQLVTRSSLPTIFDNTLSTMFIVHGWQGDATSTWMHTSKDRILQKADYNVVIVGWGKGADDPTYIQPASNARSVGREVGLVAQRMVTTGGLDQDLLECMGHSLGAHVCGYAGGVIQLGRIIGLDPAGPAFEERPLEAGLNPSCAKFVSVVHTNGGTSLEVVGLPLTSPIHAGTMRRMGHVDFYPNGGQTQPACDATPPVTLSLDPSLIQNALAGLSAYFACSHVIAIDYFIESIGTDCFKVYKYSCKDVFNLPGSCQNSATPVQTMGFGTDPNKAKGNLFLTTNASPPYCQG